MITSIILMIPLSFIDFYEGFEIYIYVPLVSIDIMVHKIIETISSCYLVYLIPPKWKYSHIRACSLPTYLMLFGKVLGCLFCLASFSKDKIEFNQHFLVSVAFLFYGIIGLLNAVLLLVVAYYSHSIFNVNDEQDIILKNLFYILKKMKK